MESSLHVLLKLMMASSLSKVVFSTYRGRKRDKRKADKSGALSCSVPEATMSIAID